MPQDSAKIKELPEQNPVAVARDRLGESLAQLEACVLARLEEAAQLAAAPAPAAVDEDAEQWRNACHLLEEQLGSLKEENSQLHSELHQMRVELQQLAAANTRLEQARQAALQQLDTAIARVEALVKG